MMSLVPRIQLTYFNSIKVRLKRSSFKTKGVELGHFNSIKVRLKHRISAEADSANSNFNSIKVRLKRVNLAVTIIVT